MSVQFQPPPTYAEVILTGPDGKGKFNPIWLKWFLDLVGVLNSVGGGGGSVDHNLLTGLQGGTANEFFHITNALYNALTGVSGNFTPSAVTINVGRLEAKQGAVVPSANSLTLSLDGNYFQISGNTQINILDSTSWQGGSQITMKFNSTPTVKHNQAASVAFKPIMLAGAVDFVATANDTLSLVYDSTDSKWYEIARAVI